MKTSNKILTTGIAIVLTFVLAALIYAKKNYSSTTITSSGVHKVEDRTLETFKKVDITGNFEVVIKSGNSGIKIEGDENLIKELSITVVDSNLVINTKTTNWKFGENESIKLEISTNLLSGIKSVGNSDIECLNEFTSDVFDISQVGNGDINSKQNANIMNIQLTGNGNISNTGKTETLDAKLLGNGDLDFYKTTCNSANVSLTGNGTAKVNCSTKLHADLLGNGDIYYRGKPELNINKTGNGDVTEDNE